MTTYAVDFRTAGMWDNWLDRRTYKTLANAIRGIRQGINPEPPGRGHSGADLYAIEADGTETWLGHADWGDGLYWLDLSDAGRAAGLVDDPEPQPDDDERAVLTAMQLRTETWQNADGPEDR